MRHLMLTFTSLHRAYIKSGTPHSRSIVCERPVSQGQVGKLTINSFTTIGTDFRHKSILKSLKNLILRLTYMLSNGTSSITRDVKCSKSHERGNPELKVLAANRYSAVKESDAVFDLNVI